METIQARQHVTALRPAWSPATAARAGRGIQQATNLEGSPYVVGQNVEMLRDLLPCRTGVERRLSHRLRLEQLQSDSLAARFFLNLADHYQIRVLLGGAVNLSRTKRGTFFTTLSVA